MNVIQRAALRRHRAPSNSRPPSNRSNKDQQPHAKGLFSHPLTSWMFNAALAVVPAFFALWLVWGEIRQSSVVIENIAVPDELIKAGVNADAFVSLLRHALVELSSQSYGREARGIHTPSNSISFTVPGTPFSVQGLADVVKNTFKLHDAHVTGVLRSIPDTSGVRQYQLQIETTEGASRATIDTRGKLEDVIHQGALGILAEVDPGSVASFHLSRKDGVEDVLGIVQKVYAGELATPRSRLRSWLQPNRRDVLPWAHLYWAKALVRKGDMEGARQHFEEADRTYRAEHDAVVPWNIALDEYTYALYRNAENLDTDDAAQNAQRKLAFIDIGKRLEYLIREVSPQDPSALYHMGLYFQNRNARSANAEEPEASARAAAEQDDADDWCRALDFYRRAVAADGRYAIALEAIGTVYLRQAHLIADRKQTMRCLSRDTDELRRTAFDSLARSTALDPRHLAGLFQFGIVKKEMGDLAGAEKTLRQADALVRGDWQVTAALLEVVASRAKKSEADSVDRKHD